MELKFIVVCYLDQASNLVTVISKSSFLITVMWQMLLVSKNVFNILSMSKMAAIRMHIKVYRLQAESSCKWRLLSGKIVVKFVLEQEHNSSLS